MFFLTLPQGRMEAWLRGSCCTQLGKWKRKVVLRGTVGAVVVSRTTIGCGGPFFVVFPLCIQRRLDL